jgi:hypothetical protein
MGAECLTVSHLQELAINVQALASLESDAANKRLFCARKQDPHLVDGAEAVNPFIG